MARALVLGQFAQPLGVPHIRQFVLHKMGGMLVGLIFSPACKADFKQAGLGFVVAHQLEGVGQQPRCAQHQAACKLKWAQAVPQKRYERVVAGQGAVKVKCSHMNLHFFQRRYGLVQLHRTAPQ